MDAIATLGPATISAPVCVHHWLIASPNGETSLGRCKRCGMEREFANSAEDALWERESPRSRWTGRAELQTYAGGF